MLARKSWQFAPDDSLPAWLFRTTLLETRQWWRGELRRRRREQTAAELGTTMKTPDEQSAFRALVPLLDEALLSLREKERTALLLRFYDHQSLRDVGATLGVGEDAAQKRVAAALEKLSQFFQRRGYRTATVAAATAALEHTAASAPAIVATSVAQAAMQLTPPAMMGLAWLSRLASLGKIQAASLGVAILVIPAAWQWNNLQTANQELAQTQSKLDTARTELEAMQAEVDRLRGESAQLEGALAQETQAQSRNEEAVRKLAELKERLHRLATDTDVRWPDDLPFVRIPRFAIDNVVRSSTPPFSSSGKVSSWVVELLGLNPEEQSTIETNLSRYLEKWTALADSKACETDSTHLSFQLPKGWAVKSIAIPNLGEEEERLWGEYDNPIQEMLGGVRRCQWERLWERGSFTGSSYPWAASSDRLKRFTLAIDTAQQGPLRARLAWDAEWTLFDKTLPIQTDLPEFLQKRFESWLRGLGVTNQIFLPQP